ncbi:MAG TPA: abhydrolase domain-containing 18 [Clostridia bacterium]|nr:abhydrolase domain-containing 18 [Clostridia bacterium]
MRKRYEKFMYNWEHRLTTRDTNRVVRPFEWGLDWTERWPLVNGHRPGPGTGEIEDYFYALNERLVEQSDEFFSYRTPTDFRLEQRTVRVHATGSNPDLKHDLKYANQIGTFLRFTSPVETPFPENNVMNARWFPAKGRRAILVLPQWNSDAISHNALCQIFNVMGIAGLRMSMPYHDVRMPASLQRADYAVSANMGRTIDAARQGVIDVRACLDWLEQQGYTELGILGTSLGSCYAFIASAHDERLKINVFNHASTYFGDVMWTGQSTRHVRAGVEEVIDQDRLRRALLAVSPMAYFDKFARWPKKSLMIYTKYDLTFLPEFSLQIASEFERRKLGTTIKALPCGHYTLGETPYKYMDAWHISRFVGKAFAH